MRPKSYRVKEGLDPKAAFKRGFWDCGLYSK